MDIYNQQIMRKPVTREKLQSWEQNQHVHWIDIRRDDEYKKQHIPGSENIPAEKLSSVLDRFPKTDTIVCICNHGKERSQSAAEYLFEQGFENAFYLEHGVAGWFAGD